MIAKQPESSLPKQSTLAVRTPKAAADITSEQHAMAPDSPAARHDGTTETTKRAESAIENAGATDLKPGLSGSALPTMLKVAGTIVAPTTLLTALLFYFGLLHAFAFFDYFRVDYTIMGLTSQDYLIRSADGLFVPLTVLAGAGLAVLWTCRLGQGRLRARTLQRARRALPSLVAFIGLVLVILAMIAVVNPQAFRSYLALPGLSLAIGVPLLAFASRLKATLAMSPETERARRPGQGGPVAVLEWAAILVLVSVGLFWSAGDYAGAVGSGRGHDVEAALSVWPNAAIYSARSLRLQAPGVRELMCVSSDPAYRFRYDGLKLILQAGGQYFFLPASWSKTAANGVAVVIPRSESLRLEFAPASPAETWPSTC